MVCSSVYGLTCSEPHLLKMVLVVADPACSRSIVIDEGEGEEEERGEGEEEGQGEGEGEEDPTWTLSGDGDEEEGAATSPVRLTPGGRQAKPRAPASSSKKGSEQEEGEATSPVKPTHGGHGYLEAARQQGPPLAGTLVQSLFSPFYRYRCCVTHMLHR
jgi:hypothetical protein